MAGVAWIVASSVELLLFLLILWKTIQLKKFRIPTCNPQSKGHLANTQDITTLMARDSIMYFAIIFSVCLLGAIISFIRERGLTDSKISIFLFYNQNAYFTIAVTVMTILAPKMLINIRAEYYGSAGITATELSWDVQNAERSGLRISADVVE
ncbi:uncharacterized protein FOMMEDRAFT_154089 [Fomitiporia mediterranea MF3/22]|uniref:uncharacterized protein n=1 Tax=Fomitiporia mediterranea (strain MF3/22) TaxID=694068 RepID=UPI0004408672|nr:uncharacterized protein FOMMEDRAFT_154089 [Fomitiporia mediterranea MF3/22]EJD04941.1 hypothetical protein FOMMEDRAFT_154089 [Fomitiporia mediterranea MF3/22]